MDGPAGNAPPNAPPTLPRFPVPPFLLLTLAGSLLFFARLGCPLQEPEEPRYAEIPRQMLEAGRFLVPVLHGQPYLDKPPLLYWLVMGCYRLFGVGEAVARLVPAFASLFTILVTYWWGKHTAGVRAGFVGAAVLCLSPRFVYLSRLLTMNSLLALWVVAALAAAHVALHGAGLRWRAWLLSAAACGLGLLTKGPVALALVAGPVFLLPWVDRRLVRPGPVAWAAYLLVVVGMAGPWYAAVAWSEPEFAGYFLWKHNVERFLTPFDHQEPVWFYLPELALAMLPGAIACGFAGRPRTTSPAVGYLVAFLWCLAFFSVAGCKRPGYLLPALPPLALLIGRWLDGALRSPTAIADRQRLARRLAVCGATAFVLFLAAIHVTLPGFARRFSLRGYLRPHEALVVERGMPVVCYPRRWDSVSFYLRRSDVQMCEPAQRPELIQRLRAQPETLLVVKSAHSLPELLRDFPASLAFEPIGRRGHVTVGLVRSRAEALPYKLAHR
jgi:4-amino-4-deoxy-L-arabinose transferase-like glycosyltransferase